MGNAGNLSSSPCVCTHWCAAQRSVCGVCLRERGSESASGRRERDKKKERRVERGGRRRGRVNEAAGVE